MADTYTVRNMRLVDPSGISLGSDEFHLNQRPTDLNGKTSDCWRTTKPIRTRYCTSWGTCSKKSTTSKMWST